jgi:hypothetical protein
LLPNVAWTIDDHPYGARVRLDHTGFSGLNGMIAGTMLRFGWKSLLKGKFAQVVMEVMPNG